ncbi:hypothetical protein LCGC14_2844370 [marine sediment metagenome]|uniref:Uncharacterized protein n=1 Tax=marine sediment metagenome TaxID=412755 RepID=A0A0F9B1D8_9ZZZZ
MKINMFLALVLLISGIGIILLGSLSIELTALFIVSLAFLSISWLVWGVKKVKAIRLYRQDVRFRWYTKMGLLESGYIMEPRYAKRYWRNLIGEFLK